MALSQNRFNHHSITAVIVSLARVEDDPDVTSRWHDVETNPFVYERRTLSAARINLQSVPHE